MNKLKGFYWLNGEKIPVETNFVIKDFDKGHEFFEILAMTLHRPIEHYMFTLIPEVKEYGSLQLRRSARAA